MSAEKSSDPSLGENSDPSVPDPVQLTEEQIQNIEYINGLYDEPLTNYAEIRTFSKGCDLIHFFQSSDLTCERWAFRGQGDAEWGLTSSLDRLARSRKTCSSPAEQYLLTAFKRRAHHYLRDLPGEHEELEWLALMQHHGAPTRLLDWTKSPYVAAFFAAAETLAGKAFAVWAIDRIAVKNEALALLYDRDQAFEGIRTADSLGSAENFRRVFFNGGAPALVAPVQPFRTNERLTIQQGLFLCPTALLWSFDMNLKQLLHHANDHAGFKLELLYKLIIMPDARAELLRELNRMNINYATLFPGLDGFARSLGTNVEIAAGATLDPLFDGPYDSMI